MKKGFFLISIFVSFILISVASFGQNSIKGLSTTVKKGDYAILEVRLNMEDEFRTVEGRDNEGLSRIALFTGQNKDREILSKGFNGYNDVVHYLNEMKQYGWILVDTYTLKGNSLIITHYMFQKVK
jgi:hypothetical protein